MCGGDGIETGWVVIYTQYMEVNFKCVLNAFCWVWVLFGTVLWCFSHFFILVSIFTFHSVFP